MTRINERALACVLKEHWLSAPPIPVTDTFIRTVEQLNNLLTLNLRNSGCDCYCYCTGIDDQPYECIDELRRDYKHGLVLYRSVGHPLGDAYDKFRALHDIKHHCVDRFCFGLPGEIASAGDTLELVLHNDGVDDPDLAASLIMSDIAAPNAAYYVDGGWGDYDYQKLVSWERPIVSKVIELGRYYAKLARTELH